MIALVLCFFTPVAALAAAVMVARPALDPLIRSIAAGTVCICLATAALHTLR